MAYKYSRGDARGPPYDNRDPPPRIFDHERDRNRDLPRGNERDKDRVRSEREERRITRTTRSRSSTPPDRRPLHSFRESIPASFRDSRALPGRDKDRESDGYRGGRTALGSPVRDSDRVRERSYREREREPRFLDPDFVRDPRSRMSPPRDRRRDDGFGGLAPGQPSRCHVCFGIGHFARDCPSNPKEVSKLQQYLPLKEIDLESDPLSRGRSSSISVENDKCFECGKKGHMARECRYKQGGSSGHFEQRCYNCTAVGHIARECPVKPLQDPSFHPRSRMDTMLVSSRPDAAGADSGCYNCGRPGHFARECPARFGASRPPMDRWIGGPGGDRGMLGFHGTVPGGGGGFRERERGEEQLVRGGEGCYECGQPGHFARECPLKSRHFARPSGGDGRRGSSRGMAGGGGGHAEDALNYELEDYMKEKQPNQRKSLHSNGSENEQRLSRKEEFGEEEVAVAVTVESGALREDGVKKDVLEGGTESVNLDDVVPGVGGDFAEGFSSKGKTEGSGWDR